MEQRKLVIPTDNTPIEPDRVRAMARAMVAMGEGRPTEEVMAAFEVAVGLLVKNAWDGSYERAKVLHEFYQNTRGYAGLKANIRSGRAF